MLKEEATFEKSLLFFKVGMQGFQSLLIAVAENFLKL